MAAAAAFLLLVYLVFKERKIMQMEAKANAANGN
ncbi:hypothetical protein predicted by Glimmer/Critica [Limosilactobacillus fermentum]|nr:hypothetical protein predicted by Glimmer/Critica [Limosilactobacillus fermentum]